MLYGAVIEVDCSRALGGFIMPQHYAMYLYLMYRRLIQERSNLVTVTIFNM